MVTPGNVAGANHWISTAVIRGRPFRTQGKEQRVGIRLWRIFIYIDSNIDHNVRNIGNDVQTLFAKNFFFIEKCNKQQDVNEIKLISILSF